MNSRLILSGILILFTVSVCSGLKCQVGLDGAAKEWDCSGNWGTVQAGIQSQLGSGWKNLTSSLTSSFSSLTGVFGSTLNGSLSSVQGALSNSLSGLLGGRRKRAEESTSTTTATTASVVAAETSSATSAAAATSTSGTNSTVVTDYYCVKKTLKGKTIRTCLAKTYLPVAKMICATDTEGAEVCTCNQDNCNSGFAKASSIGILLTSLTLMRKF